MQPQLLPPQSPPAAGGVVARVLGGLLVVPAVVLTVISLVVPTVGTISASMTDENLISRGPAEDVGFDNYEAVFGQLSFWSSLWFALSLVVVPILMAVVVAPLVAAAVSWAGGWARLTARITLSLALVVFAPVAFAIARLRQLQEDNPAQLADIGDAGGVVRSSVAMMTFGVVCAVGVMIFVPVFRAREQRRPMWPALFATAGVAVLGLIAIGLQLFTVPYLMTRFGPAKETLTPVGMLFNSAFVEARPGVGAAVATVLLALLAILGVGAVLIVVLTRLRVSLLPLRRPRSEPPAGYGPTPPTGYGPTPPAGLNAGAIVVAVLAVAAVLVALVLNALPWLDALSGPAPQTSSGTLGRTWSTAVTGALLSVGVAYLAGVGISGLRPLGRHSEWLLLPFAPWLFVGAAPLSIEFFLSLRDSGGIDTDDALRPPILVSIVSLVIVAVLCHGQSQRWQQQVAGGAPAGVAFVRTVLLPTLPLAGFLFVVTVLVNAQDLSWPLLVAVSSEHDTTVLALFRQQSQLGVADFSVASATPVLAVVLGFLAVAAIQVLHLDRMVAATGKSEPEPV
jgi:ABC-type sugar transport system permease subunit